MNSYLSVNSYNNRRADLIIVPITSSLSRAYSEDCLLRDWSSAGLVKPSMVKAIIGTIEQNQVIRKVGALSSFDLKRVEEAIAFAIGLSAPPVPDQTRHWESGEPPPPGQSQTDG